MQNLESVAQKMIELSQFSILSPYRPMPCHACDQDTYRAARFAPANKSTVPYLIISYNNNHLPNLYIYVKSRWIDQFVEMLCVLYSSPAREICADKVVRAVN